MNALRKYFYLYLRTFKQSLMTEMQYRVNFFTWVTIHSVNIIVQILFFRIIYQNIDQINGWTFYQVLLVLAVHKCVITIGSLTFFPVMYQFANKIKTGDFDLQLIKPVSPLFLATFSWVDIEDFQNLINSLILMTVCLTQLKPISLIPNLFLGVIMMFFALLFLFSLLVSLQSLAFRFINVINVRYFFWSFINMSEYPAKAIIRVPSIIRALLFPAILISSVPAEVLFGRWELGWIIGIASVSITLFFLSRQFFYHQLKMYSSASS